MSEGVGTKETLCTSCEHCLVVKCIAFLPCERMQAILDNLRAQKETGVILLPSYLEAQIVPEDIEIRLVNGNGECVLIPTKN